MPAEAAASRDALAERLFGAALGAFELLTVHLGDRLGLYRALAESGPLDSAGLAGRAGVHERYAREWLEQQAVAGLLDVEDAEAGAAQRRYLLPSGHAEVLLDPESLAYTAPMGRWVISFADALADVEEAFRTGGGVPWERFGDHARQAQADVNRPVFLNLLGREWLPAIPDIHERLQGDPPARVADVACGAGWSSIALAQAYSTIEVDGFELDERTVELARANVADAGLTERVRMHVRDAGDPELAGSYDLATVFEAVHDMSRPVDVLAAMRRLTAPDGAVLVMDERVADSFTAPGDEVERVMYTYSVLSCLPVGLSERPSAATGTVMRAGTLRRYAEEAGFAEVEVLPAEHDFFRLYRLHH